MAISLTRVLVRRSGDSTVIRNKTHIILAGFAAVGWLLEIVIVGAHYRQHPHASEFIATPICSMALLSILWLWSMCRSIRLHPDGIVIENGCFRHEIPWLQSRDFTIGRYRSKHHAGGLQMNLHNRQITAAAFSGNLIASSMGYPGLHVIRDLISQESARITRSQTFHSSPLGYERRLQLPDPWILPATALAAEACLSLGVLLGKL